MHSQILNKHKAMKQTVRQVLQVNQRTRNCDKWLVLQVWKHEGLPVNINDDGSFSLGLISSVGALPSPETIRRVRQEIQNVDGEFLPTDPQVCVKRRIKEDVIHNYYSQQRDWLDEYTRHALMVKYSLS